ncbi:hypothetical protein VNO78_14806 [Psophocarpus tetragonolobus]|uniref:Uncharacterized protein n=1 Tax=Psophocarpus tetragonolobus TaxID=3891 RepID=A0AAN9SCZ8_PSOTE
MWCNHHFQSQIAAKPKNAIGTAHCEMTDGLQEDRRVHVEVTRLERRQVRHQQAVHHKEDGYELEAIF